MLGESLVFSGLHHLSWRETVIIYSAMQSALREALWLPEHVRAIHKKREFTRREGFTIDIWADVHLSLYGV